MRFAAAASRLLDGASEAVFSDLVRTAVESSPQPEEIAFLATILARSGRMIPLNHGSQIADIASTGGIGSLSTLLGPLFLIAHGATVVKIGVPGRPAGAIDVLAQIPGYNSTLPHTAIKGILESSGFFHAEASDDFTPLDGKLFQYRKEKNLISITSLIIASLLSKKIAAGVNTCGFDIRYGDAANFARTLAEGESRINIFGETARLLGIASAFSTSDSDILCQPFIGRGEALMALDEIFRHKESPWMNEHLRWCNSLASETLRLPEKPVNNTGLYKAFISHIRAQGASPDAFHKKVDTLRMENREAIKADKDGIFSPFIQTIRKLISTAQEERRTSSLRFPDPCGIVFHKKPGDPVATGELLATVRGTDSGTREALKLGLQPKNF